MHISTTKKTWGEIRRKKSEKPKIYFPLYINHMTTVKLKPTQNIVFFKKRVFYINRQRLCPNKPHGRMCPSLPMYILYNYHHIFGVIWNDVKRPFLCESVYPLHIILWFRYYLTKKIKIKKNNNIDILFTYYNITYIYICNINATDCWHRCCRKHCIENIYIFMQFFFCMKNLYLCFDTLAQCQK